MIDRGGRARIGGWRGGARRCRRIVVLDDDRLHTPRALARHDDAPPPSDRARRRDRFAGSDRARLQSGCRERARRAVDVRRAERDREHTLGARSQVLSERRRPAARRRRRRARAARRSNSRSRRSRFASRARDASRATSARDRAGLRTRPRPPRGRAPRSPDGRRCRRAWAPRRLVSQTEPRGSVNNAARRYWAVSVGRCCLDTPAVGVLSELIDSTRSAACLTVRDASRRSATRRK